MAAEETRRIVPRGDLQGSIGSGEKRWEKGYIGNVGNVYDTVADVVEDLELMAGSTASTKGYHTFGDGGHGFYSIREKVVSDVEDGGSIIFLDNGNVAELITDNVIHVEQFGSYSDGVHDDSTALQNAINYAIQIQDANRHIVPKICAKFLYLLNSVSVSAENWEFRLDMEIGSILADIADYAIKIDKIIMGGTWYIGFLNNLSGGDILWTSNNGSTDGGAYVKFKSEKMRANGGMDCFHLEADRTNGGWINEIRFEISKLEKGRWGIFASKCHQLNIRNTGFETAGCHIENCHDVYFGTCRMGEATSSAYKLQTIGVCNNLMIIGGDIHSLGYKDFSGSLPTEFDLSDQTNGIVVNKEDGPEVYQNQNGYIFNIVDGKIIPINPYPYYIKDMSSEQTIDVAAAHGFFFPYYIPTSNNNEAIIFDRKYYFGANKINEVTVGVNNASLELKVRQLDGTLLTFDTFNSGGWKTYRYKWDSTDLVRREEVTLVTKQLYS